MYNLFFKRFIDTIISIILLALLVLPFIVIAIIIKMDSKGPVFFIQERMGKNMKIFKLIKFRSMKHREVVVIKQVYKGDSDVTKVGEIIRRFKIDELPQLFNVLMGDMALVGPRPCLVSTYEKNKNEDTDYRFKVRPGVTSNAGVSGSIYLSWAEKWELDRKYAENVSFLGDVNIILKTILVVFLGEEKFLNR